MKEQVIFTIPSYFYAKTTGQNPNQSTGMSRAAWPAMVSRLCSRIFILVCIMPNAFNVHISSGRRRPAGHL